MEILRTVIAIAITMAFTITLTMKIIGQVEEKPPFPHSKNFNSTDGKFPSVELYNDDKKLMPSKRLSRFLIEDQENPREASDHCKNDDDSESCQIRHGRNTTCCNNKCIDMQTDKANCGACKKKCKYTEACCRGECVNLSYDKRHCSSCNHRCLSGEFCVYGMCGYA